MRDPRFIGDLLLRRGLVTEDRMETLYVTQKEKGGDIVDLIAAARLTDENTIARVLAEEAERPYIEQIETDKIATALATRVPITFAKNHKMLVFAEEDNAVHV
ncbi:MAG: type II secretion system protein GspE, partial [Polyangiaceae bacterium]